MLSAKKVSLTLTYLVSAGCFAALWGVADDLFFLPLLILFLLSVLNEFRFGFYLPRWFLNTAGVLLSLLFLTDLSLENMITPFANMLLLLLVVKSFEEKRPRDIYQMLLISLLGIAVSTTFRLDLSFLIFFLYELFLGTVAFLFTNVYANLGDRSVSPSFVRTYGKFSFLFPPLVALMSLPFFLILPRTQTPLFDLFGKGEQGLVSGIAREVELGKVGEIQQDNSVVMRIYGELPENAYWRVSVFDTPVNTKWVRTVDERETEGWARGGSVSYTVLLEPTYDTFLPVLDYPLRISRLEGIRRAGIQRFRGGYYTLNKPVSKPVRYEVLSALEEPRDPPDSVYLSVPENLSPKIAELAEELYRSGRSEEERVLKVVDFFRRGFSYSLRIEAPEGDPLEHFLFKSRKGNCEYFASATALLLRLMGIPSRLVGGFRGYVENRYGGYYIVTNSMAHVWVEAYVNGRWLRIDTTPPYVSPAVSRISKLDLLRDFLITFWYRNVVDFSAQKQVSLLRSAWKGLREVKGGSLLRFAVYVLVPVGALLLIGLTVRVYVRRIRKTPANLYRKLLEKLERIEGRKLRDALPEDVIRITRLRPYSREVEFIINLYRKDRFSPYKVTSSEIEKGYRLLRKIQ